MTPPRPETGNDGEAEDVRLLRAALEVSRQVEPAESARAIVAQAMALTGGSGGFLYMRSPEGGEHELLGSHVGKDDPRRKGLLRIPLDAVMAETGFCNADMETGPSPSVFGEFGFQEMVSLYAEDGPCRCRLLMGFEGREDPTSSRRAAKLLARFLRECVPALANSLRMERVRELVIKDDQTDSFNRRYLDAFLAEEMERARRYGTALSVIFMDLDNLREVNNLHGHAAGSRALRLLSKRVIGAIRGSDKLFRYGGDEFCVVLPETDAVGSYELAERLRQTIAARPFEVEGRIEVPLTASFGVSCFPLHADSAASLLEVADQAMTRVKKAGKNSIGVGEAKEKEAGLG
jgi:diguanylate cyclase (GGDEF)-like protein